MNWSSAFTQNKKRKNGLKYKRITEETKKALENIAQHSTAKAKRDGQQNKNEGRKKETNKKNTYI